MILVHTENNFYSFYTCYTFGKFKTVRTRYRRTRHKLCVLGRRTYIKRDCFIPMNTASLLIDRHDFCNLRNSRDYLRVLYNTSIKKTHTRRIVRLCRKCKLFVKIFQMKFLCKFNLNIWKHTHMQSTFR